MTAGVSGLLLGVDVGSSSTKGVLADTHGHVLCEAASVHGITHPRPGWAEQDPETDWWAGLVSVVRELTAAAPGGAGAVRAVGVSGLGPCVVVAGEDGRPLRPAILYGIDVRARDEIAELTARFGAAEVLARGGSPLTSQSAGPKLLWLARHEPRTWERTRRFFTAGSWLVHRLTGEYVLDHHSASQCGPLYDEHENRWADDWAAVAAPGLPLPRLAWAHEVLGTVSVQAAAATGLPQGIPVASGTIDSWAEVAASGLRAPGDALLVYGTTMFLVEVDTPAAPDPRLWSTTAFAPGTRNLAAGIGSAGALAAWLRDVAGGVPWSSCSRRPPPPAPGPAASSRCRTSTVSARRCSTPRPEVCCSASRWSTGAVTSCARSWRARASPCGTTSRSWPRPAPASAPCVRPGAALAAAGRTW